MENRNWNEINHSEEFGPVSYRSTAAKPGKILILVEEKERRRKKFCSFNPNNFLSKKNILADNIDGGDEGNFYNDNDVDDDDVDDSNGGSATQSKSKKIDPEIVLTDFLFCSFCGLLVSVSLLLLPAAAAAAAATNPSLLSSYPDVGAKAEKKCLLRTEEIRKL